MRYHWRGIPRPIDPDELPRAVNGEVDTPLSLSLADLKRLRAVEIVAVNQCSGNSRGLFEPRVNGGQLANGAMGNARWPGVPLKDVLDKAGVKAGAVQVAFNGLDRPPVAATPDFVKALDIDHALRRRGHAGLADERRGSAAAERLSRCAWWCLATSAPTGSSTCPSIKVLDKVFDGFWMSAAYRIPDNACACVEPGTAPAKTMPIGRFNVRSFITSLRTTAAPCRHSAPWSRHRLRRRPRHLGVAFSADGGKTWQARSSADLGRYSFREWTAPFTPSATGPHELKVRATNQNGETQPLTALWNPAGYMRNVVETTRVVAA